MRYHNLKNVCALIAFVSTITALCIVPHMVKWLLAFYVIQLIAIWLGDDKDEQKNIVFTMW